MLSLVFRFSFQFQSNIALNSFGIWTYSHYPSHNPLSFQPSLCFFCWWVIKLTLPYVSDYKLMSY